MKHTPSAETSRKPVARRRSAAAPAASPRGGSQPTSVVLRRAKDTDRQHAAIGKLMEMCRQSTVVSRAGLGITAEVRKDRDRGHE